MALDILDDDTALSLALRACMEVLAEENSKPEPTRDPQATNAKCRKIMASAIDMATPIGRVRAAVAQNAPTLAISDRRRGPNL